MFGKDLQASLMQALNFTAQDLEANRNGTVTEAQRARLGKQAGYTRIATLVSFVIVILVFAGIGAYLFVFSNNGQSLLKAFSKDSSVLAIVAGVMGAFILVIFLSFLRTLRRTSDVARGKVSMTEGPAKLKTVDSGYNLTSYQIKVGKVNFYVQEAVFQCFIEGAPYRIYYIKNPPINTMLSAEQV
jgi:archaellum component FlaG (FlaF/FlaG flagellin family)